MKEAISKSQSTVKPRVGLTQVHPNTKSTEFQSLENFQFDIIALHGLDAETPKTWVAWEEDNNPNSRHVNWLQDTDMLPSFVPSARILTYQWNARYGDAAPSTPFNSQAIMLLEDIYTERFFSKRRERPIIFIASCFGGLLLASALVTAASPLHVIRSGDSNEVLKYTIGAIFLGTPFRGSDPTGRRAADIRYEAALASGNACSPNMLQYLRQGSMHNPSELDELVTNFQSLITHRAFKFDIICAYETLTTKTSAYKKRLGDKYEEFARERPAEFVVVDHNSARLGGTKELPLDTRHNMLHKFNSPQDSSFRKIVLRLQELIDKSPETMAQKDFDGLDYEPQKFPEPSKTACEWLIEDPSYSKWYNNGYGIFWILGHAGTGKSTLMKHAINNCVGKVDQEQTVVLSFFFHNQGKLLQHTSEGMFRALLHQLVEKIPHQMKSFTETLDLKNSRLNQDKMLGANLNESIWPTPYLIKQFEAAVEKIVERFDIHIFVDALDECKDTEGNEDETKDMYNLVLKMQEIAEKLRSKPRKFSICFACRHFPHLARLDGDNHVFTERGNKKDIEEYVCQELDREITGEEHRHMRETLKKEILQSANGNFLWVTIVVPKVLTMHHGRRPDLLAEVRKIPRRIEEYYATVISCLAKETCAISLKFFQWVCFATKPLDVQEIRFAINIIPDKRYLSFEDLPHPFWGDNNEDMENLVCTLSGGLAEIRNSGHIVLIHQSVKDYMISSGFRHLDPDQCDKQKVLKHGHDLLLTSCLWWITERSVSEALDNLVASFSAKIIGIALTSLSFDHMGGLKVLPDTEFQDFRRQVDAISDSDRQAIREDFQQTTTHGWDASLPDEYRKGYDYSQFKEWLFVDEVLACCLSWVSVHHNIPSLFGCWYAASEWTDHAVQSMNNGSEGNRVDTIDLGLDLFFSRAQYPPNRAHGVLWSPLHMAAMVSDPVILSQLLKKDANTFLDINPRSFDNLTPLMAASQNGAIENVQ
ncbi:hypothetical protein ACLX1H_007806 [Fusarium chlamydosporum]